MCIARQALVHSRQPSHLARSMTITQRLFSSPSGAGRTSILPKTFLTHSVPREAAAATPAPIPPRSLKNPLRFMGLLVFHPLFHFEPARHVVMLRPAIDGALELV